MCTVGFAILAFWIPTAVLFSVFGLTNCYNSETTVQILFWIFWWTQDLLFMIMIPVDTVLISSMWLFLVFGLRMDMCAFADQLEKMKSSQQLRNLDHIYETYIRLTTEVMRMKPFLSHVLSVFAVCSTPYICTVIYSVTNMDNLFFLILIASLGTCFISQQFAFLATASQINSLSLQLHHLLCRISARHKDQLSVRERRGLLYMMEEIGSEERLLSLHTLEGEKYTAETFFFFVLETGIQYTLLVTFGYFFKTT